MIHGPQMSITDLALVDWLEMLYFVSLVVCWGWAALCPLDSEEYTTFTEHHSKRWLVVLGVFGMFPVLNTVLALFVARYCFKTRSYPVPPEGEHALKAEKRINRLVKRKA